LYVDRPLVHALICEPVKYVNNLSDLYLIDLAELVEISFFLS